MAITTKLNHYSLLLLILHYSILQRVCTLGSVEHVFLISSTRSSDRNKGSFAISQQILSTSLISFLLSARNHKAQMRMWCGSRSF